MRPEYIKRTYRIYKDQDKLIEKVSKEQDISDSEVIRRAINIAYKI